MQVIRHRLKPQTTITRHSSGAESEVIRYRNFIPSLIVVSENLRHDIGDLISVNVSETKTHAIIRSAIIFIETIKDWIYTSSSPGQSNPKKQ